MTRGLDSPKNSFFSFASCHQPSLRFACSLRQHQQRISTSGFGTKQRQKEGKTNSALSPSSTRSISATLRSAPPSAQ